MATARAPSSGKLLLLAALSSAVLLHAELSHAPLALETPAACVSTSFRGFSDAVHWIESLHSREDLTALAALSSTGCLPMNTERQGRWTSHLPALVAKMLLQWSLVLFVRRQRAVSKPRAVALLCLCVLTLATRIAALSTASQLLSTPQTPPISREDRLASTLSLLNALFLARAGSSAVVNALLARAFQAYLCEPWPAMWTQWRRVPKYLGSKNLVLTTLFTSAAVISLLSICTDNLRALSEAAERIESVALGASLLLLLFVSLGPRPQHSS